MDLAMTGKKAIVTGASAGIGKAITWAFAREGVDVAICARRKEPLDNVAADIQKFGVQGLAVTADMSKAADVERFMKAVVDRFGRVDILVNNAGLTFTYIDPPRFRRPTPQRFWEVSDEIVENVIRTNYLAGDRLSRRVAPAMVAQGWGRIVNVTTKLDTMNRLGTHPYGASKAALEMATEVWAKEVEGTGLTINIVNPGAGANTPGMADEMRQMSRDGRAPRLVEPEEMVPPLLYVVSREADLVNGMRFDANAWDLTLAPAEAARKAGRPAGFVLHPQARGPAA
jgi:3-oxoacyl-[acyl-carrier protein] reductase